MAFPTPTVLVGTAAYFKGTTTHILWVPTIATQATPSAAEITAGKDLTAQVMAVSGFMPSTTFIDLPLAGGGFTGNVPGRAAPGDSSIQFELSSTGSTGDIRGTLTQNLRGFILFANEGFTTGNNIDIWPVQVGFYAPEQDLEQVANATVPFGVYRVPSLNVAIPTA